MSIENIAELINTKKHIRQVELRIQQLFSQFTRKPKIDFERTNDYLKRGFNLYISFDNFNTKAFDHGDEIKKLYVEFVELRRKQRKIEVEYDSNKFIEKSIKAGLKKV